MKQLAGVTFIHNGQQFDYCWRETVQCLLEFCDHVYLVEAGSNDGTELQMDYNNPKLTVIHYTNEHWNHTFGKQKLCFYTDAAIKRAQEDGYKYVFSLQCDEILSEKSYDWVRKAVEEGNEGFLVKRINLWKSPYLQLDVPHNRKPCSTEVLRLAKSCYTTYGDAESIAAPCTDKYLDLIKIFHMGFVRRREVHGDKIKHMQQDVFGMADYDKKLDQCDVFNPDLWFGPEDLKPIEEPLPAIIQKWAAERVYED